MVKNLTEGRPLNLLFFFALPMVAGNLFQQLYNMVDTAVVGKFVGEDAVAAVGSSFPIVFLSVAVASGLSMGCTVVVSQLFGAGRIHEMKTTISTAIISLGVLGLLIMGLGTLLAGPLLQLLGTDPDIMADSRTLWMTPGCTCGSTLEERCSCFCTTPSTASTTPRGTARRP
mgnify:CR=1 FL=1